MAGNRLICCCRAHCRRVQSLCGTLHLHHSATYFRTAMPQKLTVVYNGVPHISPQNYTFPWTDTQTQLPASSLDSFDSFIRNRIHIQSAVLLQCTRRTDTQTNRWLEGIFNDYRVLSLYRELQSLIMTHHWLESVL